MSGSETAANGAGKMKTEIHFMYAYDSGRSIDLARVATLIPASAESWTIRKKRDTPDSLRLPASLAVQLDSMELKNAGGASNLTTKLSLTARIFSEGVICMDAKTTGAFEPEELWSFFDPPEEAERFVDESLKKLFSEIQEAISIEHYAFSTFVRESYFVYRILDKIENPRSFLERHKGGIARLLNGEEAGIELDEKIVEETLDNIFCYTTHDAAVFDLDRCLIIDPEREADDILIVVEQALFQLVELRALDKLLDRWLDKAEDDIRIIFSKNTGRIKRLKSKMINIQALNLDALLILENLENSSKIIGDYFLGQIYSNLCGQFSSDGWKASIERRLKTLRSLYERVSERESERRMIALEIMFIVVCAIFPVLQILQAWLLAD